MPTKFKINPIGKPLDMVIDPIEGLAHSDLTDMPDVGGTNSDHDARYYTETEVNTNFLKLNQSTPQTFTNLGGGTGLMKVTAGLLGLDTSTYLDTTTAGTTYLKLDASNDPITGDLDIGSTTTGKNLSVIATVGAEMLPAITAPNWTLNNITIAAGKFEKIATVTSGQASANSGAPTAGVTYKCSITIDAISGTSKVVYVTMGGSQSDYFDAAGTYTFYITARSTVAFQINAASVTTFTISAVSMKALTDATGDIMACGELTAKSGIINPLIKGTMKMVLDANDYKAIDVDGASYPYTGSPEIISYVMKFDRTFTDVTNANQTYRMFNENMSNQGTGVSVGENSLIYNSLSTSQTGTGAGALTNYGILNSLACNANNFAAVSTIGSYQSISTSSSSSTNVGHWSYVHGYGYPASQNNYGFIAQIDSAAEEGTYNHYGYYVQEISGGTNNWAYYNNTSTSNFMGLDNSVTKWGTAGDSGIYYDATNTIFKNYVGTGFLDLQMNLQLSARTIITDTTTGLKIGTGTTQKLGFFNATPVVQQLAATDLGTVLSNLGLRAAGTAYPLATTAVVKFDHIAEQTAAHTVTFDNNITLSAKNIVTDTSTGTKIGTGTTQKLGFFNATPVVQPLATDDLATLLATLGLRASGTNFPLTSTNTITAEQLTSTDDISMAGLFLNTPSASDLQCFYMNGDTNPLTASGTAYVMQFLRTFDRDNLPVGNISFGILNQLKQNASMTADNAGEGFTMVTQGISVQVDNSGAVHTTADDGGVTETNYGMATQVTHDRSLTAKYVTINNRGTYNNVCPGNNYNNAAGTLSESNYGTYNEILVAGTITAGTAYKWAYGSYNTLYGTTNGDTYGYGVYINQVANFDQNWGFYNNGSVAHNFLGKDNVKTYFGTAQDASIYYDATDLIINSDDVGTGGCKINGLNVRADGTIQPVQLADASAANDSIYYSTTASKLVYKDSAGNVNALY